jgi:hypothetical protein
VRVEKKRKSISSRGWGPWAFSFNALLHPEILTSKLSSNGIPCPLKALQSEVNSEPLNLSEGLATTLINRIVLHKNKKAWLGSIDATESQRKRKATAERKTLLIG